MKIFSLLMTLLVSASMAFSQTSLQGTVTDAKTGEPIIFGTVALFQKGILKTGTDTDLDGFYSIPNIEPGTYEVEFSYTGYADQKITAVPVTAGKANLLDVKMFSGVDLAEVTVAYEAPLIEQDNTSQGAIFSAEQIRNMPTRDSNGRAAKIPGPSKVERKKAKKTTAASISPERKETASASGSRSDAVEYYLDGIRVAGDKAKKAAIVAGPSTPAISAGTLTAGEVNDFNSWELWQDIADIDLEQWQKHWQIHPTERYTIQAMTESGQPIVDAVVKLFSDKKENIWTARTDNTGRAELWVNAFSENIAAGDLSAEINYADQTKKLNVVNSFQNGMNTVIFETPCEQPNEIDILFVVDATGSMGDEIEFLKAELNDVINQAQMGLPDLTLNLGSLFYRDVRDEYLTRQSPFSENINQTTAFISEQSAGGGGDGPEAMETALEEAIYKMEWSESAQARLLFLVLDAPPHHTPEILEKLKTLSKKAAEKGIRIIPVAGSGIDKSTEYLTRSLALLTNGTYTFLTDHSGIGGSHIEPTSDAYDVEKLNDLLVRLILQFSEMPDCEESIVNREPKIFNDKILEKKLGLKAFPNPSSGPTTIAIKMDIDELYLTDLSGKILIRYADLKKGKTNINLGNLPNGSYLIRAEIAGQAVTERMIILH